MQKQIKFYQSGIIAFSVMLGLAAPMAQAVAQPFLNQPTLSATTFTPTTDVNNVITFTSFINNNFPATTKVDVNMIIYSTAKSNNVFYTKFDQGVNASGYSAGTLTETWNGRDQSNLPVAPGNYYVSLSLEDHTDGTVYGPTVTSPLFAVLKQAPTLAFTTPAPTVYDLGGSATFAINYDLDLGTAIGADVSLFIDKVEVNKFTNLTTGKNKFITWDGMVNGVKVAAGTTHAFNLSATGDAAHFSLNATDLTGPFVVNNTPVTAPSISNLVVTPVTYHPDKDPALTLKYDVANFTNSTLINAAIYSGNDLNTPVKQWAAVKPTALTTTLSWDGKSAADPSKYVADGNNYFLRVWGFEGVTPIAEQKSSYFRVLQSAIPNNTCAGFTDIAASDVNCNAYTWVKAQGIFTGNPDGTFYPSGVLQRDQIAKVVLEAFGKYQAGTDYCQGGNPFPDVTTASWARQYICLGKNTIVNGVYLLTGYKSGPNAGLFLPGNAVNRSEFLAMVLRNLSVTMPNASTYSYNDVPVNQWDSSYAAYAAQHLTSVYPQPNLYRTQYVTRLEAVKILYALHNQGSL